jgi:hypothetical protein
VISLIDSGRQDVEINGVINQAFPPAYRIEPTLDAHLTFAFKREPFIWSFSLDYFKSSLPLTSSTGSPPSPPASTPARPAFSTNG